MSAWIVTKGHIDVLTNGLVQHGLIKPSEMKEVGQALWDENHASVDYLYNDSGENPVYIVETTEAALRPEHLLAAVQCYTYQSCEHPAWVRGNRSFDLMDTLAEKISTEHPNNAYTGGTAGNRRNPDSKGTYFWGYVSVREAIVEGCVPVEQAA